MNEEHSSTPSEDKHISVETEPTSLHPSPVLEEQQSGEEKDSQEGKTSLKEVVKFIKKHSDDEVLKAVEEKISTSRGDDQAKELISYLEGALAQAGAPRFKLFWTLRKQSQTLFSAVESPILKSRLWNELRELSKQARKLKEIYDQEGEFAVEQMEMAIEALEKEVAAFDKEGSVSFEQEMEIAAFSLKNHEEEYQKLYQALSFFNAFANRVNTLRKELVKTDMRISKKNKLFSKLSAIGDAIFPKRKEFIKVVSELFLEDVECFFERTLSKNALPAKTTVFDVRQEVKALQQFAKEFTINTHCFNKTRDILSSAWEKLKELDKERKKHYVEMKDAYEKNLKEKEEELASISSEFLEKKLSADQLLHKLQEFKSSLRAVKLGRDEVRVLQEKIASASAPAQEELERHERERKELRQKQKEENEQKKAELSQALETVLECKEISCDELVRMREEFAQKLRDYTFLTKAEKQSLCRELKKLDDALAEKKEQQLLDLSADDQQALQKLEQLFEEQALRKKECKEQLDHFRKAKSGSGLDFEQAMLQNDMINEEKERLKKIDESIEKTVEQMEAIKQKLS